MKIKHSSDATNLPKAQSMSRSIAFLRAINVGGHTVKMETLREIFQSFPPAMLEAATALNVAFLAEKLDAPAIQKLFDLNLTSTL